MLNKIPEKTKLIVIDNKEVYEILNSVNIKQTALERTEMAFDTYIHSNPLVRWLMWARLKITISFAEINENSEVLDFGCGLGFLLPTLAANAKKTYAIDLFPQFAQRLAEIRRLDIDFIPSLSSIKDGSLDVIFATDVIEHLDDPSQTIALFKTKLKINGQLIISGPTETIFYRIGRVLAGWHKKGEYHHWNIDDIEGFCKKNGLKLNKMKKLPFMFPPTLFKVLSFTKN
jgi:2-polyprenyl-3-methyl-5-hydroxy-6-metoxy-1,4-benzoquinol methylase